MSPKFYQTARYLEARARPCRVTPTTDLSPTERILQLQRLIDELWLLGYASGLSLGQKPTIIATGDTTAPASVVLARLTSLCVELYATYLMFGLAHPQSRAFLEYCTRKVGASAPCYRTIIDESTEDILESHD